MNLLLSLLTDKDNKIKDDKANIRRNFIIQKIRLQKVIFNSTNKNLENVPDKSRCQNF